MKRLSLVRHGSTDSSRDGRLTGWTDIPLNEEGRRQARQLRAQLVGRRFASVSSSDLRRSIETAALAGYRPQPDPRLRELNFGSLEGRAWDDVSLEHQAGLRAFDGFVAPGGESAEELTTRVFAFIEGLGTGHHLIFTHGGVIRLLLRRGGQDARVEPGGIIVLQGFAS